MKTIDFRKSAEASPAKEAILFATCQNSNGPFLNPPFDGNMRSPPQFMEGNGQAVSVETIFFALSMENPPTLPPSPPWPLRGKLRV
jgi:hypothetical protein